MFLLLLAPLLLGIIGIFVSCSVALHWAWGFPISVLWAGIYCWILKKDIKFR